MVEPHRETRTSIHVRGCGAKASSDPTVGTSDCIRSPSIRRVVAHHSAASCQSQLHVDQPPRIRDLTQLVEREGTGEMQWTALPPKCGWGHHANVAQPAVGAVWRLGGAARYGALCERSGEGAFGAHQNPRLVLAVSGGGEVIGRGWWWRSRGCCVLGVAMRVLGC